MKAIYLTKAYDPITHTPGVVECIETEKPKLIHPDDVLIHIAYASICGSDIHFVKDNLLADLFPPPPLPIGHELSGVIEDLGSAAEKRGLRRGDRVTGDFVLECGHCDFCRLGERQFCRQPYVANGAQAEYIVWKADQVYRIPEGISLLEAVLFEPFTIAVGALDLADMRAGQRAFVLGAGGVGQMLIQLLHRVGASAVGTSARTAFKRELALQMGADFAVNPLQEDLMAAVKQHAGQRGFDLVFETSGNPQCAEQALEIVRPGGTVIFVSYYPPGSALNIPLFEALVTKGVTLRGLQLAQNSWVRAMELFPMLNLSPVISKVYPLRECRQAYEDAASGKCLKIVFQCSEEKFV